MGNCLLRYLIQETHLTVEDNQILQAMGGIKTSYFSCQQTCSQIHTVTQNRNYTDQNGYIYIYTHVGSERERHSLSVTVVINILLARNLSINRESHFASIIPQGWLAFMNGISDKWRQLSKQFCFNFLFWCELPKSNQMYQGKKTVHKFTRLIQSTVHKSCNCYGTHICMIHEKLLDSQKPNKQNLGFIQ